MPGNIVTDKRPLQHRDRAGQHTLHRPVGQRLGVGGPAHGHGRRARHVPPNDGWGHATAAVALHPPVFGKRIAAQLLAEVLDHVVALELTVHQHVEPDCLLPAYCIGNPSLDRAVVPRHFQVAAPACGARLSDLDRLRERADCRRRKHRQLQSGLLRAAPGRMGASTLLHLRRDRVDPRRNVRPMHLRMAAARPGGGVTTLQRIGDDGLTLVEPAGDCRDFRQFLHGKGEPWLDHRVEPVLERQVGRNVQKAAGRRDDQALTTSCARHVFCKRECRPQVRTPDVTAVDDAERQPPILRQLRNDRFKVRQATHQIEMKPTHWQAQRGRQIIAHWGKVAREQDLR